MSSNQNDYNKAGMQVFVLSMLASFAIMIYVAFFSGGIDLKEIEETAATEQIQAGAEAPKAVDISSVTEPWVQTEDMIAAGKQLYSTNCAMCHGAEGRGDGPAGASLNPKPRNLVTGPWKKGGGLLGFMRVLNEGIAGTSMQAYTHLPINQRWALSHYVSSITEAKVNEDPAAVAKAGTSMK